jgi:hypothetical protein
MRTVLSISHLLLRMRSSVMDLKGLKGFWSFLAKNSTNNFRGLALTGCCFSLQRGRNLKHYEAI